MTVDEQRRRRSDVLDETAAPGPGRFTGPATGDELPMLAGFLADQRATLVLKCAGLGEELAATPAEPSTLSLLGLVRHLADVERHWFREVLAGERDARPLFSSPDSPDGDFDEASADPASVTEAWEAWRAAVAYSDRFTAEAPHLDVTGEDGWRGTVSLRWVLIHLIEEYARHNGHADLIRERIDGTRGV
ncbi:DinB family protein [Streptomyces sp. NPDC002463]|uniref:DinB family protein n=1 Tax=Streptomyces sp. NPDC002463 TaxID=3364645 RepID=UPI003683E25D